MELRWDAVTIDCKDPELLGRFWSELLGTEVRGQWEQYVGLRPTAPGLPRLVLQRTDDPRPAKNTVHLDLHVPTVADIATAVARVVELGGSEVADHEQGGQRWSTVADPEGNVFCLVADAD
jgi:predicted enzyme related to lactoylglutathione lyase